MTALEFLAWFAVIIIATWLSLLTILIIVASFKASAKTSKTTEVGKPKLTVVPKDN